MSFLSSLEFLCPRRDLNPRPLPYQGSALPLSYKGVWKGGPGWLTEIPAKSADLVDARRM